MRGRLRTLLLWLILLSVCPCFRGQAQSGLYDSYKEAQSQLAQGNYGKAEVILKALLPGLPTALRSLALSDLGVCYKNLGQYYEADRAFQEALSLCASDVQRDKINFNYSNFLLEIGDYQGAVNVLDSISSETLLPSRLISLSHARYFLGAGDEAVQLLDSCLRVPSIDESLRRIALQNKGFYSMEAGDYSGAVEFFSRSVEGKPKSDAYYQTLGNIALSRARLGSEDKAVADVLEAVEWFKPGRGADYRIALRKAGEIWLLAGRPDSAISFFKEFYRLEKESVTASLRQLNHDQRLNLWHKEKPLLSKCFLIEDSDAEFMYEVAVFRRLTSLLGASDFNRLEELLAKTPAEIRIGMKPGQAAIEFVSYTDIDGRDAYAAIVLPAEGPARFVRLFDESFLHQQGTTGKTGIFNAIKSKRAEDKNRLYRSEELGEVVWRPILEAAGSGVNEIFFAPEGVFHFWGIENMPFEGREGLTLRRVTTTASLDYAMEASAPQTRTLLVGGMRYGEVPSDSEVDSASHYASDLLREKMGTAEVFADLPGTLSEVDAIGSMRPGAMVVHDIGESRLKEQLPEFELVHLATHGYSLDLGIRRRPAFMADSVTYDRSLSACGLALSGANVLSDYLDRDDGVLSAREICDLDLSGVEFVIMSACQTALGDITDEGAAGLLRGLKNAGARSVMATLWSVNDESTMLFMQAFHRLLEAGFPRHEAYRGAQRYLRGENVMTPWGDLVESGMLPRPSRRFSAPYYWAPFILTD